MRIVLNPGHSTSDPGAVGPTGLTEAWVVRQVVQKMLPLGEYEPKRQPAGSRGLGILLLALMANPPDVLVSVHCNAAGGNAGRTADDARIYAWAQDADNDRASASLALSRAITQTFDGLDGAEAQARVAPYLRQDREGKSYSYTPAILRRTARRAVVLVELNFISNPAIEARMRDPSWHDLAAHALDAGIDAALHRGATAATDRSALCASCSSALWRSRSSLA